MTRKFFSAVLVAALFVGALIVAPVAAFAQSGTEIAFDGFFELLRPYIIEVAALLVSAGVGWLSLRISALTGMNIEARHREALHSAMMNGVQYGLNMLARQASSRRLDVESDVIADAIAYVQRSVPDAIKHFGLTPDRLGELIEARLPQNFEKGTGAA